MCGRIKVKFYYFSAYKSSVGPVPFTGHIFLNTLNYLENTMEESVAHIYANELLNFLLCSVDLGTIFMQS